MIYLFLLLSGIHAYMSLTDAYHKKHTMASLRKPDSAYGIRKTVALCETTFKNTIAITIFLYLYCSYALLLRYTY